MSLRRQKHAGRLWSASLLGLSVMVLFGCESLTGVDLPDREPEMTGVIVATDRPTSFSGDRPTIHVKEKVDDECGTIFMVQEEQTEIVSRTQAGLRVEAGVGDLREGREVRVWSPRPWLMSCPMQAGAGAVELLPE